MSQETPTVVTEDLPFGLTESARLYPDLINKAISIQSDPAPLALVRERLVKKIGLTEEKAQTAEVHFLRFVLLTEVADGPISPTSLGDDYWHEFLMFTRTYRSWCQRHFGQVIDHEPGEKTGAKDRVKELYQQFFGANDVTVNAWCSCRCCCYK